MLNALVTGSRGFIGRHVVEKLKFEGCKVKEVFLMPGHAVEDFVQVWSYEQFDVVVHAAANVGGRHNIDGAPLAVAHNAELDRLMFEWAAWNRPGVFVYLSSSAAYPVNLQHPWYRLRETDLVLRPPDPDNTYGAVKMFGEFMAQYYRGQDNKVVVVRPFSGYGADQALDYPYPSFLKRVRERADPFEIWGDGNQTRDFVHVDDIMEILWLLIQNPPSHPVNIGTGVATSFNQLAAMMMDVTGHQAEIKHLTEKPVGVTYRVADTRALSRVLGEPYPFRNLRLQIEADLGG